MKKYLFLLGILVFISGCCKSDLSIESPDIKEDNEFSNYKVCIIVTSDKIECDDVIYDFNTKGKYEISNILQFEYEGEFDINNYKDIKILKDYNYLQDGIFKEYYSKSLEKLKTMTLDSKIGQVLLARVSDINQIKDLKTYQFGGYLLFKRDFQNKTKEEVINMIKDYQDNSKIPLLIAADEEGGIVSRISSNDNLVSTPFKSPRVLYKEGGLDKIKEDAILKNKILSELGINLNLAPVVDIAMNENDYMYKRSLGCDANTTAEFAKLIIQESKNSSVSYCLKHFPGYGNNSDTHIGLSYDTRSLESIKENDLIPFKVGIENNAEAILVSHNIVSSIDENNPSSLSDNIHNLLRKELSFSGVVVTDDLSMDAIDKYYKEGSVVKAITSGNDLLIVTDYKTSFKDLKKAIDNKNISENILNKRVLRILAWKYYKGLIK